MNRLVFIQGYTKTSRLRRLRAVEITTSRARQSQASPSSPPSAMYLHVGPDGDCWTGHSMFAAKHLQPDYVQSIEIPRGIDDSLLVPMLEEDPSLAQQIYDAKQLPSDLSERIETYKNSNES